MAAIAYKPVHITAKNSKIYGKVNELTIRDAGLLHHTDEHSVVLINVIKELSLYTKIKSNYQR